MWGMPGFRMAGDNRSGGGNAQPGMRSIPRGRWGVMLILVLLVVAISKAGHGTVKIPSVSGLPLSQAYLLLHDDQLDVTVQHSVDAGSLCTINATLTAPRATARVTDNYAVVLDFAPAGCSAPGKHAPAKAPPDFSGQRLSKAVDWAADAHRAWSATLPPIRDADAQNLYANFRVISQKLRVGVLDLTVTG